MESQILTPKLLDLDYNRDSKMFREVFL